MKDIQIETVSVGELKPHPRNYRRHADDQLEHIMASMREHGVYRNVIIAKDGTILAGHGVTLAAQRLGLETLRVVRLDIEPDDPKALKVMAGDNEIAKLAEIDDRALTELLKAVNDSDDLLGSGFDEQQLAALLMVSRPKSEVEDFDAAAEWVGMPEYEGEPEPYRLIVQFKTEEHRQHFMATCEDKGIDIQHTDTKGKAQSAWYPPREDRFAQGSSGKRSQIFEPA